jgi:hypothetical protein
MDHNWANMPIDLEHWRKGIADRVSADGTRATVDFMRIPRRCVPILRDCIVQHASTLQLVSFRGNGGLGDAELEPMFAALARSSCLEVLDVSFTALSGRLVPSFFELIKNSTTLYGLIASELGTELSFEDLLCPALACNTSLTALDLAGTDLAMPDAFFSVVRRHPKLRTLQVDRCFMDNGEGRLVQSAAWCLHGNSVLTHLYMEKPPLEGRALAILFASLHANTSLRFLHVGPIIAGVESDYDAECAVTALADVNVTLLSIRFGTDHASTVNHLMTRNSKRRASRVDNARSAVVALLGVKKFRSLTALRHVDRGIMRMLGRLIMNTRMEPAWEDPRIMARTRFLSAFSEPQPAKRQTRRSNGGGSDEDPAHYVY